MSFVQTANQREAPQEDSISFSPDGKDLGSSDDTCYIGDSPVTAMIPYEGGVLTAFANVGNNPSVNAVFFSADGKNLGSPNDTRYIGDSPITAMIPYDGGVLTAFANVEGAYAAFFSSDGKNLGSPNVTWYTGVSPITAMIPYEGGVLTAFANVGNDHFANAVFFSTDFFFFGDTLGSTDDTRYSGMSTVTAMSMYGYGVLTAFHRRKYAVDPQILQLAQQCEESVQQARNNYSQAKQEVIAAAGRETAAKFDAAQPHWTTLERGVAETKAMKAELAREEADREVSRTHDAYEKAVKDYQKAANDKDNAERAEAEREREKAATVPPRGAGNGPQSERMKSTDGGLYTGPDKGSGNTGSIV